MWDTFLMASQALSPSLKLWTSIGVYAVTQLLVGLVWCALGMLLA